MHALDSNVGMRPELRHRNAFESRIRPWSVARCTADFNSAESPRQILIKYTVSCRSLQLKDQHSGGSDQLDIQSPSDLHLGTEQMTTSRNVRASAR